MEYVSLPPAPTHTPTPTPLKEKVKQTTQTISEEFSTLVTNAFALMAALSWSEAVKSLFANKGLLAGLPVSKWGPLFFAVLTTCLALMVASTIGKYKKEECTKICPPEK